MDLTGKNICIVADGMGIAFETCKVLMAKNIAKLAILHNNENPKAIVQLRAINPNTEIFFFKFTITESKSAMKKHFDEVMTQMNHIDVLINGATICKEQDIDATIGINLTGMIKTVATVLPFMDKSKKGRGGLIVNIASVTGLDPSPVYCAYTAAKFGVIGFTRSLADPIYYENTGVAVIAVCPGPTKTLVRHNMTSFLPCGQQYVNKLKNAPSQDTAICAASIVKAIEHSANGDIWIADMGNMELVKPQMYWNMSKELINWLKSQQRENTKPCT